MRPGPSGSDCQCFSLPRFTLSMMSLIRHKWQGLATILTASRQVHSQQLVLHGPDLEADVARLAGDVWRRAPSALLSSCREGRNQREVLRCARRRRQLLGGLLDVLSI